jgi:hypothetical protein
MNQEDVNNLDKFIMSRMIEVITNTLPIKKNSKSR